MGGNRNLVSSSVEYLKAPSLGRSSTCFTLLHLPTFYVSMTCNFIFTLMTLSCTFFFSVNDDLELTSSISKIENCLSDLDKWMALNKLKLNKDKTELLYLYSKHNPQQSLHPFRFGSDIIQPSSSSRNIGVVFDSTMSMLLTSNLSVNLPSIIFGPFPV